MAVVVEYCHVEPARAPVHLIRPCMQLMHGQMIGQRLSLALVGVVGHMATSDHVRWPVRHHQ